MFIFTINGTSVQYTLISYSDILTENDRRTGTCRSTRFSFFDS
jgi:hypothetical protein